MKFLRCVRLLAVAAAVVAAMPAVASATTGTDSSGGSPVEVNDTIHATNVGNTVFDGAVAITCKKSTVGGKVTEAGSSTTTIKGNVETLTFEECGSHTVTVVEKGSLEGHTDGETGNANFTSSGAKLTVLTHNILGTVHCIYVTSATQLGTLDSSNNTGGTATLTVASKVPRESTSFACSETTEWTAEYTISTPDYLRVDTGSSPAATTLTTSLSGEEKSGEEITVLEGTKVKDQASLSGENAATATGTIKYFVYSDSKCEKLVTKAGETEFTEGKVPASEEKTLEAGTVYYWQAEYTGDSKNAASKSTCGKEVLTVKATTILSTSLSGEEKSGEEITVLEGTKVKDTATLSGTKFSTATGKAKYKVYSDSKCETQVAEAGEVTVAEGKVPASEEKTLEAGAIYYWQASYEGDSLHQASKSTCGKEVLTIKALVSISTILSGPGAAGDETVEGEEISVPSGGVVADTATLSGTNASKATGTLEYFVYSDNKCEELVAEAGEVTVEGTAVPTSGPVTLEEGTYYWQAVYAGDALHKESTSKCGDEIAWAIAPTSLATTLSGGGKEGTTIEVAKGTAVSDSAKLTGKNASEATGNVEYFVYSDFDCEELVANAGKVTVSGETVPASTPQTLEPGIYLWKAVYSGDSSNYASKSACGSELLIVTPRITTELSGGETSGESIEVVEGTLVRDSATLYGGKAAEATGTVEYFVYSDEDCEELAAEAGEVEVEGSEVPPSEEVELEPGAYYWVAQYSGDANNPAATSACGSEIVTVVTPTTLTTTLSGGEEEGAEIEVEEGTAVSDSAELSGPNAETAEGAVSYAVYGDSECTELVAVVDGGEVEEGEVPDSEEITLPAGTYYWRASYTGDGVNQASSGACGAEIAVVTTPITTMLSSGEESGTVLEVDEGAAVTDTATLHGPYASEAKGTVEYFIYADNQCEEMVKEAGGGTVEGASLPPSEELELEPGIYYWQAAYSGDGTNPKATSACGVEELIVANQLKAIYAALGDSFSAGEGIRADGGAFYPPTDAAAVAGVHGENRCHRSALAWPALVAKQKFGAGVLVENTVFDQAPPRFIFRACSGAKTVNLFSYLLGQADEWVSGPVAKWIRPTPAQGLWLTTTGGVPGGKPNKDINVVTLTIGGNDAGFVPILRACVRTAFWFFNRTRCLERITEYTTKLVAVQADITTALVDAGENAPNARIAVPYYPSMIFLTGGSDIPVLIETYFGRDVEMAYIDDTGPAPTIAARMETFISKLNARIRAAVEAAQAKKVNVQVIPETYEAFFGHRFGSAGARWMNGVIRAHMEESFHPNRCGHQALAWEVYRVLEPKGAPPAKCP